MIAHSFMHAPARSRNSFLDAISRPTLEICGYLVYTIEWGQRGFIISLFSYSDLALLDLEMMIDDLMNCSIPTSVFYFWDVGCFGYNVWRCWDWC
jgi:hypothetical protein